MLHIVADQLIVKINERMNGEDTHMPEVYSFSVRSPLAYGSGCQVLVILSLMGPVVPVRFGPRDPGV